jgi:hypothetical protein
LNEGDVEALLGVARKPGWGDEVTVILHYISESEEYEEEYEAVTMTGVPHNVSITGGDRDSAEVALDQLLAALRTFGFAGRVAVEDATKLGGVERYEL